MVIESFEPTAVFRKEPDGSYVVFCPEVDGVFSEGETLDEAREMIREALEGVIETVLDEDIQNFFKPAEYKSKPGDIVEKIKVDKKFQVAVSIKMAREKAGLTQAQVAKRLGIKQQNVSRYEKGKVIPSADRFISLIEATNSPSV
ncbi:MAG: type II toxin-antitoxin system HicB family antitoxin [Candidatus Aminicenantes bacterium]|nr:type II toxin-antitoxin system HicB family antitoxin [Candidatus Aminicenantes bacterium]